MDADSMEFVWIVTSSRVVDYQEKPITYQRWMHTEEGALAYAEWISKGRGCTVLSVKRYKFEERVL